MKIRTPGGLAGLVGGLAVALGMGGKAKGDTLKINNQSSSATEGISRIQHRDGALEGYDSYDLDKEFELNNLHSNALEIYSDISGYRLGRDARPFDSLTPFNLKLVYNGTISSGNELENHFLFEYGTEGVNSFGTLPLTLQTPLGSRYDVRSIIDGTLGGTLNPSPGIFDLPDLAAGSYTTGVPYAFYQVDFNAATPEPSTWAMLGTGALFAGGISVYRYLGRGRRKEDGKGKTVD
ncbi:MAG: PEP-CTERM sorting domain-containing protein, partial [Nanoarchaeota archaeon]